MKKVKIVFILTLTALSVCPGSSNVADKALMQHLTKNQMLTMIHDHVQFDQGFSGADADAEVARLSKQPLPVIRDQFTQYQNTFVTKDRANLSDQSSVERQKRLQESFNRQKSDRSLLHKVPLVQNIASLLPSKITNWSDDQLFHKLALKMQDLGFDPYDINQEIERLKKSSIADLQKDYPHLQQQLSKQLYYFDTAKHHGSETIKATDYWLQQLHQWGSTAAMVASYGASAAGYDSSLLDVVAGFALFDPKFTFASGTTKRDLLDMVYAQYAAFDALQHVYLDHQYQANQLWTQSELLQKISDCLVDLKIKAQERKQRVEKYQKLSKQELQDLYQALNYFSHDQNKPIVSSTEKKILLQTKLELLTSIQADLRKLDIAPDKIDETMKQLRDESIQFVRAARVDVHDAVAAKPIKRRVMPTFTTSKEAFIRKVPKTIAQAALDHASSYLVNDWNYAGKRPAYIQWKMNALKDHVANQDEGKFEHFVTAAARAHQLFSIAGIHAHGLPGDYGMYGK